MTSFGSKLNLEEHRMPVIEILRSQVQFTKLLDTLKKEMKAYDVWSLSGEKISEIREVVLENIMSSDDYGSALSKVIPFSEIKESIANGMSGGAFLYAQIIDSNLRKLFPNANDVDIEAIYNKVGEYYRISDGDYLTIINLARLDSAIQNAA